MIDNTKVIFIVATGNQNQIGLNNDLPWVCPSDLIFFKETTMNKYLLMGRKTVDSLPFRLKDRKVICLTNQNDYCSNKADFVISSIDELKNLLIQENVNELFIAGGSSVYSMFNSYMDKMFKSIINYNGIADTYLDIDLDNYKSKVIKNEKDFIVEEWIRDE